jgi:hypothetical protein
MNLTKKNLYFFFPYRGVGGVPVLFLRLANYLSNMNVYNIFLIDYEDGYMAKNYDKDSGVKFVGYSQNTNIKFENNDIVVFQSMPLWGIPPNLLFSDFTKLIYWNLHPYNIFGYASSISKYFKNKFVRKLFTMGFRYFIYANDRKAVKLFDIKKSIFFMDGENLTKTKELLDIKINNPLYLPLIIDNIENIKENYMPNDDMLNCIWLGRIGDFKVHILLYTLKKLNAIVIKYKKEVVFTIVGTGEYLDYLKHKVSFLSNIKIEYINYIDPIDLKSLLKDKDMGFAMGTAALDFAKYGLPTVLLDFDYEEITSDYKFNWLYCTQDYTLGRQINDKSCQLGNNSLQNMLNNLEYSYKLIADKTFKYIENNFTVEMNVNKFVSLLENSKLVYKDLDSKWFRMNLCHKLIGAKKYYND